MEFFKRFTSSIILIPIVFFFIFKGSIFFNFFLFSIFCISCYEWYKMSISKKYFLAGIIFLIFSFFTVFTIRNSGTSDSLYIFIFIINVCISTDIGGYIFGNIFKGPKLTKISPNKTYSGMLGGFILSIVISYLFAMKYNLISTYNNTYIGNLKFIILIFVISSISQIGDLIISYFKRASKIKNTGKIFPGHGGMLDRIDGMIFVFPILYLLDKF